MAWDRLYRYGHLQKQFLYGSMAMFTPWLPSDVHVVVQADHDAMTSVSSRKIEDHADLSSGLSFAYRGNPSTIAFNLIHFIALISSTEASSTLTPGLVVIVPDGVRGCRRAHGVRKANRE